MPRKDELKKGNQLLDEGRYDEAIDYFTEILNHDNHHQYRLALASAYGARAGLTREDFVAIADVAMMKTSVPADWGDVFKMLFFIQAVKERWDYLPTIKTSGVDDVKKALEVLAPSNQPSVRLFSAALRTIYIKATMGSGLDPWLRLDQKSFCRQNIKPLLKWSDGMISQLQELTLDLKGAYPSQKERYEQMQIELSKASEQISQWNAERSLLCP